MIHLGIMPLLLWVTLVRRGRRLLRLLVVLLLLRSLLGGGSRFLLLSSLLGGGRVVLLQLLGGARLRALATTLKEALDVASHEGKGGIKVARRDISNNSTAIVPVVDWESSDGDGTVSDGDGEERELGGELHDDFDVL